MIELTNTEGEPISVRKDAISLILPPHGYALSALAVIVVCGVYYAVRESRAVILQRLK